MNSKEPEDRPPESAAPETTPTVEETTAQTVDQQTSSGSRETANSSVQSKSTGSFLSPVQLQLVKEVIDFGFSNELALHALETVNFESANSAINWILDNSDSKFAELTVTSSSDDEDSPAGMFQLYKMIFVVNCELRMGVGKTAAQVGHAALGLYQLLERHPEHFEGLSHWCLQGQPKVVLKGTDTEHLCSLKKQAEEKSLPCYAVHDAGRTQVAAGSFTVLSIFGTHSSVDPVTGELQLL